MARVRSAAVAGSFYDADPENLRREVDFLLNEEKTPKLKGVIRGLVSPHAGYMFSGTTAAYVYDALRGRKINRVFLLGPSHYVALHGCALPVEKSFGTPLGDLAVDTSVIGELKDFPLFQLAPEIHRHEHSLEMQLPFIRQALGRVQIVPIIVGSLRDEQEMRLTGQILSRYLTDEDIVLVSSDFTHYGPRYDFVPFEDDAERHVRELDEGAFQQLQNCDLSGFIAFRERTHDTICGYYPCAVLLSMLPAGTVGTLLSYQTSRDIVGGADDNSVSYMAVVFSNGETKSHIWQESSPQEGSDSLSDDAKEALLQLARAALTEYVKDGRCLDVSELTSKYPALEKPAGVFVTLYKATAGPTERKEHKELRGCIGYIWPVKSLAQSVVDNAIGAATKDPRFKPVTSAEVDNLQIDINVLTAPHPVGSFQDIELGRDGVIMYKAGRQSVFLPAVATEFGWTLDEMLSQLSLKAGCGVEGWRTGARFDVFQATSFSENLSC